MWPWKRKHEDEGEPIPLSQEDYNGLFPDEQSGAADSIRDRALKQALATRQFEIELYWKRATYFWTFIGAAFGGFAAVQAVDKALREELSLVLGCLGLVFSVAWYCVNRGSKFWQENWENHVDLLEGDTSSPLFKIVTRRSKSKGYLKPIWCFLKDTLTGPAPLSVSKINQLISVFVVFIWLALLCKVSPGFASRRTDIDILYTSLFLATALICLAFFTLGRTDNVNYKSNATRRTAKIVKE